MCSLATTSGGICEEFKLANFQNDSTAETNENTQTPQLKQRNDLESQCRQLRKLLFKIRNRYGTVPRT